MTNTQRKYIENGKDSDRQFYRYNKVATRNDDNLKYLKYINVTVASGSFVGNKSFACSHGALKNDSKKIRVKNQWQREIQQHKIDGRYYKLL